MKLLAKIFITLACVIIMLHAVVPHHHHDGCGEVECFFCEHHHHGHDDDHGHGGLFDLCKLQDMLSHLVLTTKDDETYFAALVKAEAHELFVLAMPAQLFVMTAPERAAIIPWGLPFTAAIPSAPVSGATSLRAPPVLV